MTQTIKHVLPRNSLLWLLGSQFFSMLPLFLQLPLWLPVVWAAVVLWRMMEFFDRWQPPNIYIRVLLVITCLIGLRISFGRFLGMEPMVAMLLCAALLKQLEMRRHRDAVLLVYLTYFLLATQFLFTQTLLAGLFGLLCFWVNSCALLSLHQSTGQRHPLRSLKLSVRMLVHSVPLMLLLFVLMPRVGSLWAVPSLQHSATTGVSDSMSPGDFTHLMRSGGVAFRVAFEGELPERDKLYWRGLVFSRFDGRRWQSAELLDYRREGKLINWEAEQPTHWRNLIQPGSDSVGYNVVMEPSRQPWLYSLGMVESFSSPGSTQLGLARDFRLIAKEPIFQRLQYRITSFLDYRLEAESLPGWRRENELSLPSEFNPESLEKALQWRTQEATDEAYIERVLSFYRDRFSYSFEPPPLGMHSVDDFLWGTQEGFCEHFASSFVVLMRAANIPARVVVGYMGGEYNPEENYLVVHQYDAHAWAEVWLEGKGWVTIDPTAVVAPERVTQSLGEAYPAAAESLISLGRYRNFAWVAKLRLRWDALQYEWDKTVLGFDQETQWTLLNRWMNGVSPLKLMLVMLGGGGLLIALMSLHLWWQSRPKRLRGIERFIQRVELMMGKKGFVRRPGETVGDFTRRASATEPELKKPLNRVRLYFEQNYYAENTLTRQQISTVLTDLKQALSGLHD